MKPIILLDPNESPSLTAERCMIYMKACLVVTRPDEYVPKSAFKKKQILPVKFKK